jgi:hypothetical protein
MSETDQAAAERGTKTTEDALLLAMLETRDASLADLAKAAGITLRNGLPDKKKVSRLLLKLRADKITRKVRDTWRLTKEGKSEAERVKNSTASTLAEAAE